MDTGIFCPNCVRAPNVSDRNATRRPVVEKIHCLLCFVQYWLEAALSLLAIARSCSSTPEPVCPELPPKLEDALRFITMKAI